MASAIWPPGLPPAPRLAELDETPPRLLVRTEMDAGPAKVRRRNTANVREFTVAIDLTRDQVALLDAFYLTTVHGGADPFTWTHPRTANDIDFRFVDRPVYRPRAPRQSGAEYWRATFKLEALPGTEITGPAPTMPPGDDGMGDHLLRMIRWPIDPEPPAEDDPVWPGVDLDQLIFTVPPVTPVDPMVAQILQPRFDDDQGGADQGSDLLIADPFFPTTRVIDRGEGDISGGGGDGSNGDT